MKPAFSLILPANNEAAHIGPCLQAVLQSEPLCDEGSVQFIVVPNGCSDQTAAIASGFKSDFEARGWHLDVIELDQGSKLAALNVGDHAAKADVLGYLDADVVVSPHLITQVAEVLNGTDPTYASGKVELSRADSFATRAYAKFYLQTPFMKQNAPGCGFFAMNRAGRERWNDWPTIISDDTFARLNFAPDERHQVEAGYQWPLVEGLKNLIKVRKRQNAGVEELDAKFPELKANDAKIRFEALAVLKAALRHPIGTLAYGFVSLTVKFSPTQNGEWKRGR